MEHFFVLSELKENLLKAGKSEGCISFNDLNELLPDEIKDPEAIEKIFNFLGAHNIEIVTVEKSGEKKTLSGEVWEKKMSSRSVTWRTIRRLYYQMTTPMKLKRRPPLIFGKWDVSIFSLLKRRQNTARRSVRVLSRLLLPSGKINRASRNDIRLLKDRIALWEKRDPTLKPKKQQLNFMRYNVVSAAKKYPDKRELFELRAKLEAYSRSIEIAKDTMIRANLRSSRLHCETVYAPGITLADLIQEGNLGLMRAVFRFDYTKGNKFSTYASWWIRQAITRAILDKTRTIRLPVHFLELRSQFFKAFYALFKELGESRPPLKYLIPTNLPMDKILSILEASREPISLETPIGDDDSDSWGFSWKTRNLISPYDAVQTRELSGRVKRDSLNLERTGRENYPSSFRHRREGGIYPGGNRTSVSMCRGRRIRQIEKKALNRLRHSSRRDKLKNFHD